MKKEIIIISIIIIAGVLVFGWSFWYWDNYPEVYPPAQEISQRCGNEEKDKPYCVGFSHGYDWAVAQMRMDEALQNFYFVQ